MGISVVNEDEYDGDLSFATLYIIPNDTAVIANTRQFLKSQFGFVSIVSNTTGGNCRQQVIWVKDEGQRCDS